MSTTKKAPPVILGPGVTSTPGVCGGKPCIAGHRIRILDIYVMYDLQGHTPEEILEAYPSLTMEKVRAGIAYYLDHKDEVKQSFDEDNKIVDELMEKLGPGPLELKLLQQNA